MRASTPFAMLVALLLTFGAANAQPLSPQTCRITGDSIAVMTALAGDAVVQKGKRVLVRALPCASVVCGVPGAPSDGPACSAKGAMATLWILRHTKPSEIAVISAASNDILDWHPGRRNAKGEMRQQLANKAKTMANLEAIRSATKAARIVWIVPALKEPGEAVREIAAKYHDAGVAFDPGPDGVHPRNPKALAVAIKKAAADGPVAVPVPPAARPKPTRAECQAAAAKLYSSLRWIKRYRYVKNCMAGRV